LKAARERTELKVVDDQFGAPTSSAAIAEATKLAIATGRGLGLYHLSAAGRTTWHGFAQAIVEGAGLGTSIKPIKSAEYPVAARRPRNSVLDNSKIKADFGIALPAWHKELGEVLFQASRHAN
jgi:dTDP-4-dehydrorhamnose reductase